MFQRSFTEVAVAGKDAKQKQAKPKSVAISADEIIRKLKDEINFGGIFYDTQLSQLTIQKYPVYIIVFVNDHWLMIYFNSDQIEIYDSLCNIFLAEYKYIRKFILNNMLSKAIFMLPQVQSNNSNTCGYFITVISILKSRNVSFQKILSMFSNNLPKNDKVILKLYNKIN